MLTLPREIYKIKHKAVQWRTWVGQKGSGGAPSLHALVGHIYIPSCHPPPPPAELAQVCLALSAVVPSAATLIIVVCVGFLVLMVVLGLVRIHSLHRRVSGASGPPGASSDPKDPDLFWDDSALTIIVNPMEVSGGPCRVRVHMGHTPSRKTPNEHPLATLLQSYQSRQVCVAGAAGGQQDDEDSSDSEAADSPSSDERRIIETPPHRY